MRITEFNIKNFKGIEQTSIQLADFMPGNVVTLIGLNESGKTSILEAISHFITQDQHTHKLVTSVWKGAAVQDLIPKDRKAAFTGDIKITAQVIVDDEDVEALAEHLLKTKKVILDKTSVAKTLSVERSYVFTDSLLERTWAIWDLEVSVRTKSQRKHRLYTGEESQSDPDEIWEEATDFLDTKLPKIVYFPTFLFDFPGRIYLEGDSSEINEYYKQVIQDVLDCQGEKLSLKKHVIDRLDKVRGEHSVPETFLAALFKRDEKKLIDAVLQKASVEMSKVIFDSWNQILGRDVTGKRVQIEWLLDGNKGNAAYLEVSIVDGQSTFSLSERSLGFRWFFSFLLFTQFRTNRKGDSPTIFLFDEPAANLHSKAQIKLLETFGKIAQGSTYIIYSTHSHYMVNPLWLEKAYIVRNKATDYDSEIAGTFNQPKTDIHAIKYRTFVGSYPAKVTYFQPVLDALEVTFSPMVRSDQALIVEGKHDYYAFKYLRGRFSSKANPEIFPGTGAGSASELIKLFRGWGVQFCVVLDGDKAGKTAKEKYMRDFLLQESEVATLADIDPGLDGKAFEDVIQEDALINIRKAYGVTTPNKAQIALHFQELLATRETPEYPATSAKFKSISKWIDSRFPDSGSND